MKLAGILTIGTYYSPWFPYNIASMYKFVDSIVVVNAGYDLSNPQPDKYNCAIVKAHDDIKELDLNGKIKEVLISDCTAPLTTQISINKGKTTGTDIRGLTMTTATRYATQLGAEWILKTDSDQVLYEDAANIRNDLQSYNFYQYEFTGDVYHLSQPPPDSPYNDCYDIKTEILTEDGFKFFRDLSYEDKVASLNSDNTISFVKPLRIIVEDYNGPMHQWIGESINLMVTPNHKLYVKTNSIGFRLKESQFVSNPTFLVTFPLYDKLDVENFILPSVEYKEGHKHIVPEKIIKMDDWLKFLGLYLTDGSIIWNTYTTQSRNGKDFVNQVYRVLLSQSKSDESITYVKKILDNIGYSKAYYNSASWSFYDKQLWIYLKQFGRKEDRFIPRELINSLSKRQLQILFDSLIYGDGHKYYDGSYQIWTCSLKMVDSIQEIAIRLGYRCSTSTKKPPLTPQLKDGRIIHSKKVLYSLSIATKKQTSNTSKCKIPIITQYSGKIYCVEVPNHIIFVRRNLKMCWSGNSVFTYLAHPHDFYGCGSPSLRNDNRLQNAGLHCAHLRWANPLDLTEQEKLRHFFGRHAFGLFTNVYGEWSQQLLQEAATKAEETLYHGPARIDSNVKPPEVTLLPRNKLVEYLK